MSDDGLGAAVLVTALAVGAAGGGLAAFFAMREIPEPPAVVEVLREYSEQELQVVCLPFMRQTATSLEQAQTRVSALEIRIRDKEVEIARLEDEMLDSTASRAEVGLRLNEARQQLTGLEQQLADAVDEKTQLIDELQKTREQLSGTRLQLAASEARVIEAREEGLDHQWDSFVASAQHRICVGGNAAQLEYCREHVKARLSMHRLSYKECVRSGQAEPEVKRASAREEIPAEYATWIDEAERTTRGWYLLFCDPALPEAQRPRAHRTDGHGGVDFD